MATDIRWPVGLQTILKMGKSRNQQATYMLSDPRNGPPYRKNLSRDVPVTWNATFRFKGYDATIFWSWFRFGIDGGRLWFILPIATEYGLVEHEVMFLPDTLLPVSEESNVFTYTATLLARELVIPEGFPDDIYAEPEIFKDRSILDPAVNWYWPKSGG